MFGNTMKTAAGKGGVISQFTCMSSVIFLTHHEFLAGLTKNTFEIDTIYDSTKNNVWKFGQPQNTTNTPMQTLHILLKLQVEKSVIDKISTKYPNSFYNITGIDDKNPLFIQDKLPELNPPTAEAGKNYVANAKNASKDVPDDPTYVKHGVNVDGVKGAVRTKVDGEIIVTPEP